MPNFEIVHILLVTSWEKLAYCNVLQISPSVMHWAMCHGGRAQNPFQASAVFFPPSDSGPVWFLADTMSHFLLKEYTQFAIFKPHFPRNLFSSKSPHPLNDECSFFTSMHWSLPTTALKYIVLDSTFDSCGLMRWLSWLLKPGRRGERANIVNEWKAAAKAYVWCY